MRIPLISASSQQRLVGGALVLAATQLGASVLGLFRERFLNQTFPALDVVDVYISSFRLSDLLFQVCIMAGFSVALVPLLAKYHAHDQKKEMGDLLSGVTGVAALTFGIIALIVAIIFPWIAPRLVQFQSESLDLYITFGRLALLTNFLFVFGNAFGQYLITIQRYWVYGITPMLYTLGTIIGTVFLSGPEQFGQLGPMVGTVGGAVLYVLLRLGGVLWSGVSIRPKFWHPDLPELIRLMIPRMAALGALQFQLLLFDSVASGLPPGSVTINANARNFQSVTVGVAGIALAQSAFSLLSQSIARRELNRFWIYLRRGIVVLLVVTIPGAIALTLLAPVAAWLVHLEHRVEVFRIALFLYALSIPFESINHLLLRAFYAAKDSVLPAAFGVLNGATAIGVAWFLQPYLGVYALPLGFTVGQILEMVGLASLLPATALRCMNGESHFRSLYNKLVRKSELPEEDNRESML